MLFQKGLMLVTSGNGRIKKEGRPWFYKKTVVFPPEDASKNVCNRCQWLVRRPEKQVLVPEPRNKAS